MIPICLVTGFLGSGKTTLLKRIVRESGGRRLVFLVNEFAAVDVDGTLLADEQGRVVSIPGGSIFCRCLVTEFIARLKHVSEALHTPAAPVEGVVIEASGMANPKVIGQMLRETRLDTVYRLATIVSVVDPGSFLKLLHTLPSIRAQVEAADVVLLNKVDLHDEERVLETERVLRGLNGAAGILRTVRAEVALDLFGQRFSHDSLAGEYAACRDPLYEPRTVRLGAEVDAGWMKEAFGAAQSGFYRAKGYFRSGGRPYFLDFSSGGGGVEITEAPGYAGASVLAFILRPDPEPAVLRFLVELERQGACRT